MYTNELEILKNTLDFLFFYTQSETQRDEIKSKGYFRGKRFDFYIQILTLYSPNVYLPYYKDLTKVSGDTSQKTKIRQLLKLEPDLIDTFLDKCWRNQTEYIKLREITRSPGSFSKFSEGELQNIEEWTRQGREQPDLLAQFLTQKQTSQGGAGGNYVPSSVDEIAAQIKNTEDITEVQKRQVANILSQKIKSYGKELVDPKLREELIKRKIFTQSEVKAVLEAGWVKTNDVEVKYYKEGFKDEAERQKAFLDTAERLLKERVESRIKEQEIKQPSIPKIKIPSSVQTFTSNILITISKPLNRLLPVTSSLLSTGLDTILKGGGALTDIMGKGGNLSKGRVISGAGGQLIKKAGARMILANPLVLASVIIGVFFLLFIMLVPMGLLETTALLPPFETGIAESAPLYPPGSIGGSCPDKDTIEANRKSTPETCKYFSPAINIFGDLTPTQIEKYKNTYKSLSKRDDFDARVDDIVEQSRSVGLNPIIFLGYWRSEGFFSYSFGCDPRTPPFTFEAELTCALGLSPAGGSATARCARSAIETDPTKKRELEKGCELLKQIRNKDIYKKYPISYPIKTFDDFAETYGSAAPLLGDADKNMNCVNTYNTLVEVALEVGSCTPASTLTTTANASCPIPNGKIGCGSYGKPEAWGGFTGSCRPDSTGNGGHCNQNYKTDVGICGSVFQNSNLIRTAKSVDVATPNTKAGDPVFLPEINGQKLKWKYIGAVSAGKNFGFIRLFQTVGASEGIWSLHFVHVNKDFPGTKEGDIIDSGTAGASILNPWIPGDNWPHAHVTLGLNVGDSLSDLKDYSPNWKFADRELGLCTK